MTTVTLALPSFLQSEQYLFSNILQESSVGHSTKQQESTGLMGEAMLFNLLTQQNGSRPAYAAISAYGHGFDAKQDFWLHVDPVELMVDAGNVCLVGRDHLLISEEESRRLIASLNKLLKEDDLEILYGSPSEWYLKLPTHPDITTYPLTDVIAKDIRAYLPTGSTQHWWHKLLTELQMLLFDHEVNIERQKEGKPTINSIWPWGEGSLSAPYQLNNYCATWNNCSLVKGLVALYDQETSLHPIEAYSNDALHVPGNYLIVYNHYDQNESIIQQLSQLLNYFNSGKIAQLSIYLGSGEQYHWRTKQSIFARLFKGLKS
jgi:hypothetical protein